MPVDTFSYQPQTLSIMGESLRERGWWQGQLLSKDLVIALTKDAKVLHQQEKFNKAAIGTKHNLVIDNNIRGDYTYWLNADNSVQSIFLQQMNSLLETFQNYFPIPLNNFEGHYSYYPTGTYYKIHMDNARHNKNRVFSVVTYLNEDWQEGDGGELALYDSESRETLATIAPTFGTTAIFFSADFPHEVKTTNTTRYSLTGWFTLRT